MDKPLSIVVAIDENFAIGKDNGLLCHLPGDLKRFKEITQGHQIIMGRNTWESLPKKPLPNRENIVLTNNQDYIAEGATVLHSIDQTLNYCHTNSETFIVGGAKIYEAFLPWAQKLYITHIYHQFNADTFIPKIDFTKFTIAYQSEILTNTENIKYQYITYIRKMR